MSATTVVRLAIAPLLALIGISRGLGQSKKKIGRLRSRLRSGGGTMNRGNPNHEDKRLEDLCSFENDGVEGLIKNRKFSTVCIQKIQYKLVIDRSLYLSYKIVV